MGHRASNSEVILLPMQDFIRCCGCFAHECTAADADCRSNGYTRWSADVAGRQAWVEWGWGMFSGGLVLGVPPIRDSNIYTLDANGEPMAPARRNAALASMVAHLPWRPIVMEILRSGHHGGH